MTSAEPIPSRDGPRDECGVFGVYAPESDVSRLAYFALYALQHRGQESAGIASAENGHIIAVRDLGLVSQVCDEAKLKALSGEKAIGHVRYSTTGSSAWENAQPIYRQGRRDVALAHNGNLINAVMLHSDLRAREVSFQSTSDSEIIAAMLADHPAETIQEAVADVVPQLEGAFSTVVLTAEGRRTQVARRRMGEILWREAPVEADLVISVPDSGNPAAGGYALASGIPRDDGLIKNRYVARTFIQPGQELRKHGLRMKFNPLPEIVGGKRLVVVDDSIVRGNTTRQIIGMLRDAGATEVHLRISAPPIRHTCHYGIDMSTPQEMVAHERTVEEVAEELGADSLAYLSLDGLYEAIGTTRDTHCDACFTGEYPLERTDTSAGKFALEELAVLR